MYRCGLVLHEGKFRHTVDGGFGCGWLSDGIQEWIVKIWNPVGCWLFGHGVSIPVKYEEFPDDYDWDEYQGLWHCCDCCIDYDPDA